MGVMDIATQGVTSAIGSKLSRKGGNLGNFAKAQLVPIDGDTAPIEFNFNPETIRMGKRVRLMESAEQGQDQGRIQFKSGTAWEITFPDLIFDTYETKEDVRDTYINRLESLIYVEPELHSIPRVKFTWGKFCPEYTMVVVSMDVSYEMFLSDGTPVRAKVKLALKSYETLLSRQDKSGVADNQLKSPDHARVYSVRRGDTLPLISQQAYDTPSEWRRIADYNSIEDPLRLEPGAQLLIPPILK
jgi:LysM repeat protein